jgi:hypothetical protein
MKWWCLVFGKVVVILQEWTSLNYTNRRSELNVKIEHYINIILFLIIFWRISLMALL